MHSLKHLFKTLCFAGLMAGAAFSSHAQDWRSKFPVVKYAASSSENREAVQARFKEFSTYFKSQLGVELQIYQATDYAGAIQALTSGQVHLASLGPALGSSSSPSSLGPSSLGLGPSSLGRGPSSPGSSSLGPSPSTPDRSSPSPSRSPGRRAQPRPADSAFPPDPAPFLSSSPRDLAPAGAGKIPPVDTGDFPVSGGDFLVDIIG